MCWRASTAVFLAMVSLAAWPVAAQPASGNETPDPSQAGGAHQVESGQHEPVVTMPERPWEVIEVAIALDTSGSMENLLEAARLKLWEIVSDLSVLEPTPTLRVALLSFGNFANQREPGWVALETDFTEDLDMVSERLFELTSEGGNEYIGSVLNRAVNELSWLPSSETLKLLFVVGNEPANQDPRVGLTDVADVIRQQGISLHLIFCGDGESEEAETWVELAELALGKFSTMDHRTEPVKVQTPFDQELAALGAALNETFVPLGEESEDRLEKLIAWDERVEEHSLSAAASRAEVKSSRMFSSSWDLVDATEAGRVDLYELDEAQLPQYLSEMSLEERETYVEDMRVRRAELRDRIAELSQERRQHVVAQMEAKGIDTSRAFDTVVRDALREELEVAGFHVPGN